MIAHSLSFFTASVNSFVNLIKRLLSSIAVTRGGSIYSLFSLIALIWNMINLNSLNVFKILGKLRNFIPSLDSRSNSIASLKALHSTFNLAHLTCILSCHSKSRKKVVSNNLIAFL